MVDPETLAVLATTYQHTTGVLGTGLAMTMMLMGAGIGVARGSPMPALSGIAGAVLLHWGPAVMLSLQGISTAELDAYIAQQKATPTHSATQVAQVATPEKASAPILVVQNKPALEQASAVVVKVDKAALWENQE